MPTYFPGGGGGTSLISEYVADGTTGTVTFNNIPSSYRNLAVVATCRSSAATTTSSVIFRLNNDSGANYDLQRLEGTGATASAVETLASNSLIFSIAASTAPASVATSAIITIPSYKNTTFQKSAFIQEGEKRANSGGGLSAFIRAGWWRNTAAITRLDFILQGETFITGSTFTLYGSY